MSFGKLSIIALLSVWLPLAAAACSDGEGSGDADADAPEDAAADDTGTDDVAVDRDIVDVPPSCEDVVCQDPCIVYVDLNVADPGEGLTPETAFQDVQSGIDAAALTAGACCTCDVHVAEGTYFVYASGPEDTILLREGVRVFGGYPEGFSGDRDPENAPSILDGRSGPEAGSPRVQHVVTGSDRSRIDGFFVTMGRAVDDEDELNADNYGGGMFNLNASPEVIGCVFEDNEAVFGGGMYNMRSFGLIENSLFASNRASLHGGGVFNRQGAPEHVNCTFTDNDALSGGAMYVRAVSTTSVTHDASLPGDCLFEGNTAENGAAVFVSVASPAFEGCRFEGNVASNDGGGAAMEDASPRFTRCTFSENASLRGGALSADRSEPALVSSTFEQNSGTQGGALFLFDGPALVLGCLFNLNEADEAGALMHSEEEGAAHPLRIVNSIFTDNRASVEAGAVKATGLDVAIVNSTLVGNMVEGVYDGHALVASTSYTGYDARIVNSIVWANGDDPGAQLQTAGYVRAFDSIVQRWTVYFDGGLGVDPLFVDLENRDLNVWPISHAVDSGRRTEVPPDSLDLDGDGDRDEPVPYDFAGNARIQGGTVDMGALESPELDNDNWPQVMVDARATGAGDGSSWADAYTSLHEALTTVIGPGQIWVAAGTYRPESPAGREAHFRLPENVAIYGGFDPAAGHDTFAERDWSAHETILSGDLAGNDGAPFSGYEENAYNVVVTATNTILDGFTISGGNANSVYSPDQIDAGGVRTWGSLSRIFHCLLSGNRAEGFGGALLVESTRAFLRECTFEHNEAGIAGGAIYVRGTLFATGCTIVGNYAELRGGGIFVYEGQVFRLTNSILWSNSLLPGTEIGAQLELGGSDNFSITYCDMDQDEYMDGEGNFRQDPLFVSGSWALSAGSPCIDTGDNNAVFTLLDGGGHPRVVDGDGDGVSTVDMGAYEYQP